MNKSIQPGDGYTVNNFGGAASLSIDDPPVQFYPDIPLTIQLAKTDKVYVIPGSVNQLIPKVDGTYIDALPRPTITVSASGYIILRVERVANQPFPNNPIIYYNATIPADTTTYGHFALASVTRTGSPTTGYSVSVASFRSPLIGAVHVSRASFNGDSKYYWWG
jgi:hypothetical protein